MIPETTTVQLPDRVLAHVRLVGPPPPTRSVSEAVPHPHERTLVILHGGLEHGGYYERLALAAAQRNWNVVIPDHRGHGVSAGPRVHVDRFDQYVADVQCLADALKLVPAKTAILGHSMGGLLAARYAQTHPSGMAALVLVAPFFKSMLPIPPLKLAIGRILTRISPRTRFATGIRPEDLSLNPEYLAHRNEDPLVERRVTVGWFAACERAMQEAMAAPPIPCPMLLVHGSADRIACVQTALEFARKSSAQFELGNHAHAVLQEAEVETIHARILNWLEERMPTT